ncbi:MAG: hypothetical protein U9N60_12130 [Thermodesulfobacteriota bacterium]|nr:hypothetical protein [Thermodesulfobacteriota bacterium]
MLLFVNDLSIHGQFPDIQTFKEAISRVMTMREIARQFGRQLYCHRNLAYAQVTKNLSMPQAIQRFDKNEQRSVMQWLTRNGPFWEDIREHSPDEYMECNGNVVTDTAIGEAAYCRFYGSFHDLVSLTPSDWDYSPISVNWIRNGDNNCDFTIDNHWDEEELETTLRSVTMPIMSWRQLATIAVARCPNLAFSNTSFAPLEGLPFVYSAAQRLCFIFDTLNRFKSCFDTYGRRTLEGHDIYCNFFTGKKGKGSRGALFSDSSKDEKRKFKKDMMFPHPNESDKTLFCPWHGKVQTPQLRVHFSWPVRVDESLFIVYVGPKITKR